MNGAPFRSPPVGPPAPARCPTPYHRHPRPGRAGRPDGRGRYSARVLASNLQRHKSTCVSGLNGSFKMFAYLRPVRLPCPLPAPAVAVLPFSVKTKRRFKERETRLTSLDIEMSLHLAGHTAARGTSSTAEAPVGHWLSRTSTARTSGASGRAGALQCTCVGFETTKT